MATETLIEGTVTFAAGGWSGSGIADSNDYIINKPFGPITAGLDQSGLTTGIESMWFNPGTVGTVGGGSYGPLIIDADASADAYIANYGSVTLYLEAGGGSSTINMFSCGGNSINYLQGGSFPDIVQDGGTLNLNESTDFDDLVCNAGSLNIEYLSTNADSIVVNGGTAVIKRVPTAVTINGGRLVVDADDAEDMSGKSLTVNGGTLDLRNGAFPTVNFLGGEVDLRRARNEMTLGGTEATYGNTIIHRNDSMVDISAVVPTGSSKTNVGGSTPI